MNLLIEFNHLSCGKFCMLLVQVANVRFELAVAPDNPNVPVYYNRKEAENFVKYTIASFNAATPDPSAFELPKACQDS